MKMIHNISRAVFSTALAATLGAFALGNAQASGGIVPTGSLGVEPLKAHEGTQPILDWTFTFPRALEDVVDIDDNGKVTVETNLEVEIRIIGAAIQGGNGWWDVDMRVRTPSSNWGTIFYGTHPEVDPSDVVYSESLSAGDSVELATRYDGGDWFGTYKSTNNSTLLVNGDTPPNYAPAFDQGDIESFLAPYIGNDGKIDIGPLDAIYLCELYSQSPGSTYFDMQDAVILVTFSEE